MITAHGNLFPQEQTTDRTCKPGKGWKPNRVFEGPEAMIQSMANNIIATSGRFVRVDEAEAAGPCDFTVSFDGIADGNQPEADANGEPVADADSWN